MERAVLGAPTLVCYVLSYIVFLVGGASGAEAGATKAFPTLGSIAGSVFDAETNQGLANVTIVARTLAGEAHFEVVTGEDGDYFVADAPSGVYTFTLSSRGVDYPVRERLDVRVGMPFLLESCFELDGRTLSASVRSECDSSLVEQARVATIGPHRFLAPFDLRQPEPRGGGEVPSTIEHEGIQCLTHEHFPQVDAVIAPGEAVQTSRVYFRSDKYPDFYYVEMVEENPTIDDFRALLPKPSQETERIIYYVESVDSSFDSLQTPEYDPEVIDAEECARRGAPAWFTGADPSIVIGATQPGASAIPPGFQAVGITGFVNSLGILSSIGGGAAGGGVAASTTGLVLVVGGGAAAAAGATIAATGEEEASPP